MQDLLKKKERELEEASIDAEIAAKKAEIAEKKKMEKDMKRTEGRDWKKILGAMKVDTTTLKSLYGVNPELKELTRFGGRRA